MNKQTSSLKQKLMRVVWVAVPIAVGVLVLISMAGGKKPPVKVANQENARAVRTITVPKVELTPQVEGYGTVEPAQVWTAVAQVAGRIVAMHPKLRDGEILPVGTLLFRIDPVDYELNLAQAKAELAELDVQKQNTKDSLNIEERNLRLAERERQRLKKLANKGTTSQSSADEAERAMLSTRMAVQNLRNTLALLPTQRKLLQAKLTQAERDLAHAEVRAPFNLRIANLQVEVDQYVAKGQNLFEGDAVDRVEVVAQVAMSSLRNLFIGLNGAVPSTEELGDRLAEYTGLKAVIRLDMGNHIAEWQAEFVRFSDTVDTETRTMGVVVALDKPMEKIIPGYRPPLSKGMFVRVMLRGHAQADRLVIPRTALRNGQVMLIDDENRLNMRTVDVLYQQNNLSVIHAGLDEGMQVVISDLIPAVEGMLLQPRPDEQMQEQLIAGAN